MSIYKPTWLYIKQHNQTGLKYFGMTRNEDPIRYMGSGKYWQAHLKIHGKDVSTPWCQLFEDEQEIIKYARSFSIEHNIVKSKEWANLVPEPGEYNKGSGSKGWKHTEKAKQKIGEAGKGRPGPRSMLNRSHKEESKIQCGNSLKGRKFNKNFNSKTWEITTNGSTVIVKNLRQWCVSNNLIYSCVHRCAKSGKPYKGYVFVEFLN